MIMNELDIDCYYCLYLNIDNYLQFLTSNMVLLTSNHVEYNTLICLQISKKREHIFINKNYILLDIIITYNSRFCFWKQVCQYWSIQ